MDSITTVSTSSILMHYKQYLTSYFNGTNLLFDLHLQQPRTQFQQKVRAVLLNIKTGVNESNPPFNKILHNSIASFCNHIAFIITCYQVIEGNLPLEEYAQTFSRKQRRRQHELYHCNSMMQLLDTKSFHQQSNIS
ncbi:MAG: hypothetical protein WEA59_07980 [Ferruginibacter sp.]